MKKIHVTYVPSESRQAIAIPDGVYEEATLADAWRAVILSTAKLKATTNHYGHNVDVTAYPYFCSDCAEEIR